MDLSIIIPCHNLENYIDPLLATLKQQVFEPYKVELIFVCNSCTDKTGKKILDTEFPGYENVIIINTEYPTVGPARNAGLDKATGEYIWFIDGDDWLIDAAAIKIVMDTMKLQNEDIISFEYEAPNFKFFGHPSMVWQYCMKRSFIGDMRFGTYSQNEDVKFLGNLFCEMTHDIYHLPIKIYHYNYMREGSNMWKRIQERRASMKPNG